MYKLSFKPFIFDIFERLSVYFYNQLETHARTLVFLPVIIFCYSHLRHSPDLHAQHHLQQSQLLRQHFDFGRAFRISRPK